MSYEIIQTPNNNTKSGEAQRKIYRDERGQEYWLEGPTHEEVGKEIKKKFWTSFIILAALVTFFTYIIGTGRIPFVGNLTDEIYKYQVQRYYDTHGINKKADPDLTYDKDHPGKLIEDGVEDKTE